MIGAPNRATLRELYQAVTKGPLEPDDPAYTELFPHDEHPLTRLQEELSLGLSDSTTLIWGSRGVGKTTGLRRLAQGLPEACVMVLDLESMLPVDADPTALDVKLGVAMALGVALGESGAGPSEAEIHKLAAMFRHLGRKPAALGGRQAGTLVGDIERQVQALAGPWPYRHVETELDALLESFQSHVRRDLGKDDLVVVLEGLDHQSAAACETLLLKQAGHLVVPRVHLVLTLPPSAGLYVHQAAMQVASARVVCWPNCIVSSIPGLGALSTLDELVSRRGDWRRLLGYKASNDLIKLSGGNPRELLQLVAEVCRGSLRRQEPDDLVRRAKLARQQQLLGILTAEAGNVLRHLQEGHALGSLAAEHLPILARLLDLNLVLPYEQAGEVTFDVLPSIPVIVFKE
ncbi:MAG: hypothetical protein H6739_09620 [Alphaproteobacteria bacterium]|nr:hypothetical protein [Alphaproteobacteria bacterium]